MPSLAARLVLLGSLVSAQRPTVTLPDAVYRGNTFSMPGTDVDKFLGIRFAAKPERFAVPKALSPGNATVDATSIPAACIQQSSSSGVESEDCLYLNVFAPSIAITKQSGRSKPVMVWFHGGGLMTGSIGQGTTASPDGSSLASLEDVIIVASQYRLGVFGFPGNVSGLSPDELNPGFRDQKMTLQWVQANIASFGGDPKQVTIFGESGGAVSVDSHLLTEINNPPFRGAILQSGSLHTFTRVIPGIGRYVPGLGAGNKAGEAPLKTLATALNCTADNAVTCLKSQTAATIKSKILELNLVFTPVDDGGKTMVSDSDSARRAGRTAKVPVIVGSTFQEALIFPQAAMSNKSIAEWAQIIYPNDTAAQKAIVDAYSIGAGKEFATLDRAVLQLHSEFQFHCITAYDALMISASGIPTWRYVFNASVPGGAGHGSELSYIFGLASVNGASGSLSQNSQAAWSGFAYSPTDGPGWDKVGSTQAWLADLGGPEGRAGSYQIEPEVVDSRCPLFYSAYDPSRPKSI